MFCKMCGAQIADDAAFCPRCGAAQNEAQQYTQPQQVQPQYNPQSVNITQPTSAPTAKRFPTIAIIAAIIAVAVIAVCVVIFATGRSEESKVKASAKDYMESIKSGPDGDQIDYLVGRVLGISGQYSEIASLLLGNLGAEDALDIYRAIMKYMDYEITGVKKIADGHYEVTVRVRNLDCQLMASLTLEHFVSRYTDGGILGAMITGIGDLTSDKSEKIAQLYSDVADEYHDGGDEANFVSGEYVLDVRRVDKDWNTICEEGIDRFLMNCAGFR